MRNPFKRDTVGDARKRVANLEAELANAREEVQAASSALGILVASEDEGTPALRDARHRLSMARDRTAELEAALPVARSALERAEADEEQRSREAAARRVSEADLAHLDAARAFDEAASSLGAAYDRYRDVRAAADTARRAAGLRGVHRNPGAGAAAALLRAAPMLVRDLRTALGSAAFLRHRKARLLAEIETPASPDAPPSPNPSPAGSAAAA